MPQAGSPVFNWSCRQFNDKSAIGEFTPALVVQENQLKKSCLQPSQDAAGRHLNWAKAVIKYPVTIVQCRSCH